MKKSNNNYDKSLPFDVFMSLSREDKTLYLLSYARQYNLDILSLKKYDKIYKGVKVLSKEDIDSQLYESLAVTLGKLEEVGLVVRSSRTKKIKKFFFKNNDKRERAINYFKSKKCPTLLLENVLIIKPKLSAKVLKEHKEAKARGEFPKFPKRKREEVYVFDIRKLKSEIAKYEKSGYEVELYKNFFQATSHVAHYFRLNFIHQMQKHYTFLTRNMRMPKAGFHSQVDNEFGDSDSGCNSIDNYSASNYSEIGWGNQEVNGTDGNDITSMSNQTISFLTDCDAFHSSYSNNNLDDKLVDSYNAYLETAKKYSRKNYTNVKMLRLLIFFWNAEINPSHILETMDKTSLHLLVRSYVPAKYDNLRNKMEQALNLKLFEGTIGDDGKHLFASNQPDTIVYEGKTVKVLNRKWDSPKYKAEVLYEITKAGSKTKTEWVYADDV